jgi:capsular polysaccharide transport system permease protein
MTIKLKVNRYNLRRSDPVAPQAPSAGAAAAAVVTKTAQPPQPAANTPPRPTTPSLPPGTRISTARPAAPVPPRPTPEAKAQPPVEDGFGDAPFPTAADPLVDMMTASPPATAQKAPLSEAQEMDQIRKEGLTGRQLRMARRLAQKYGLPATSDFDAVRLLRQAGHDPFHKGTIMELIAADEGDGGSRALTVTPGGDGIQLPQTVKPGKLPSPEVRIESSHLADIQKIQRDIAKRRRRRSGLLAARLFFFVALPTLLAAWYYYVAATPLYATRSEFVIQQSNTAGGSGLGGLLTGTQFATSQDSIAVQGYLQSRDAMLRLDKDMNFRAVFSNPNIDPIQRLDPKAGLEAAYKVFKRNVKISYDPTEGIVKMEVIAPDPATSVQFSKALIGYAEDQVDHLTQRLREDQMRGAREAYDRAEGEMLQAQRKVVALQEQNKVLSSEAEVGLITAQIGQLETQLSADRLSLAQMESNARPNAARMEPLKRRIATLDQEIATLRSRMTGSADGEASLAQVQSELLVAQADVQTRQLLLAQSLTAMENSRAEANRQVRYLSISVAPIEPDEAAYPRAFENTLVAMLVFAGIYLMLSMTAAILKEQATS